MRFYFFHVSKSFTANCLSDNSCVEHAYSFNACIVPVYGHKIGGVNIVFLDFGITPPPWLYKV